MLFRSIQLPKYNLFFEDLLNIPHKLAVPKLTKIVINAGIGSIKEDNKAIEKMKKDQKYLIQS